MHLVVLWTAFVFVIAILAAAVEFTDIAPAASEMARIVFYLILALSLFLLIIGFTLI